MDEVLERELKWDVDEHFAVPRLDDIVAGSDVERSTVTLNSAYYDTADGDLQTHGVLLRRSEGDDDTGWQLKVPDAEGRVEIRTGLSDTPPSELTDALTGMRLGKPLVNVATIRTTRIGTGSPTPGVIDSAPRATTMCAHRSTIGCWRGARSKSSWAPPLAPCHVGSPNGWSRQAPNPAAIRPSSPASRARRDPKPRAEPPQAGPWRVT